MDQFFMILFEVFIVGGIVEFRLTAMGQFDGHCLELNFFTFGSVGNIKLCP
jgi:hypothetical protein